MRGGSRIAKPSRRGWATGIVGTVALTVFVAASGSAAQVPTDDSEGGVKLRPIAPVEGAVFVEVAPGRQNRDLLFVVQQAGTIQITEGDKVAAEPFLDITDRVSAGAVEDGLLSLAFALDYASSGKFYVYFTNAEGNIQVSQFTRSPDSNLTAQPESERTVIEIPHPGSTGHNGGQVAFGPEGNLWLATGGSGSPNTCDPGEDA